MLVSGQDLERVLAPLVPVLRGDAEGDLAEPLEDLGVDPVAAFAAFLELLQPVVHDAEHRLELVCWAMLGLLGCLLLRRECGDWPDDDAAGRDELERAIDVDCAIGGEHGVELDVYLPRSGVDPWSAAMVAMHLAAVGHATSPADACTLILRGVRVGRALRPAREEAGP